MQDLLIKISDTDFEVTCLKWLNEIEFVSDEHSLNESVFKPTEPDPDSQLRSGERA